MNLYQPEKKRMQGDVAAYCFELNNGEFSSRDRACLVEGHHSCSGQGFKNIAAFYEQP